MTVSNLSCVRVRTNEQMSILQFIERSGNGRQFALAVTTDDGEVCEAKMCVWGTPIKGKVLNKLGDRMNDLLYESFFPNIPHDKRTDLVSSATIFRCFLQSECQKVYGAAIVVLHPKGESAFINLPTEGAIHKSFLKPIWQIIREQPSPRTKKKAALLALVAT